MAARSHLLNRNASESSLPCRLRSLVIEAVIAPGAKCIGFFDVKSMLLRQALTKEENPTMAMRIRPTFQAVRKGAFPAPCIFQRRLRLA